MLPGACIFKSEFNVKLQHVHLKIWVCEASCNCVFLETSNKKDVDKMLPGTCIFKSDSNVKMQQVDLNFWVQEASCNGIYPGSNLKTR